MKAKVYFLRNYFSIFLSIILFVTLLGCSSDTAVINKTEPSFAMNKVEHAWHDCTFIEDELVSFNKPSDGNAYYINTSNWQITAQKKINFIEDTGKELEMKSCDYKFGKLIVGSGRAIKYEEKDYTAQGSKLYIFYDATQWKKSTESEINFKNCGKYNIIDISDLGTKTYGFWADEDDYVYVSCNLFNDIYLIKLGKGETKYEKGIYNISKSDEYNGTYSIISQWSQDGKMGKWSAHGGQYYNGYLYLATNEILKNSIYRCILKDDGTLEFEEFHFNLESYDIISESIDGLCIKNGIVYAQPLYGKDPFILTFSLDNIQ